MKQARIGMMGLMWACLAVAAVAAKPVVAPGRSVEDSVLPAKIGDARRTSQSPRTWPDAALAAEFGWQKSSSGEYKTAAGTVVLTIHRFADTTGAYSALSTRLQAPAQYQDHYLDTAYRLGDRWVAQRANFVVEGQGRQFEEKELNAAIEALPHRDRAALPALPSWLPADGLIEGSQRFIMGPESQRRFAPELSRGDIHFDRSEEAIVAEYQWGARRQRLIVLNYPTPQMARAWTGEFGKRQGFLVKRSGPLMGLIIDPADGAAADRLLSGVKYEATFTELLHIPRRGPSVSEFLWAFVKLGSLIAGLCLAGGALFGGYLVWRERRPGYQSDQFTTINLHN